MKNRYAFIVDDEESVRNALQRGLRRWAREAELTIVTFGSAQETLQAVEIDSDSIRIILSDLRMPQMDGLTLLKLINSKYPSIPGILLTGNIDIESIASKNSPGVFALVEKPWEQEILIDALNRALEYRAERF